MALSAEIRDQAYQFFCQEAPEFLQAIEEGLLSLHQDQSTANIHKIMRAAHSIKGGAASVELHGIKQIAHKLEDVFRALYNWEQGIEQDLEELLLHAFDALRTPLITQIQQGSYDEEAALAHALPVFEVLEALLGEHLHKADTGLPTAAELGVDIVQVVFSGDVQQAIDRLQKVVEDPSAEVTGEFRAQAEVFIGIGQLLNLPGFTEIAQTVIAALDAQPESVHRIARVAIENFRMAQKAVLEGDRVQGGSPSSDLQAFSLRLLLTQPWEAEEQEWGMAAPSPAWLDEDQDWLGDAPVLPENLPSEVALPEPEEVSLEDLFISTEEIEEFTPIGEMSFEPTTEPSLDSEILIRGTMDSSEDPILSAEEELSIFIADEIEVSALATTPALNAATDQELEDELGNWLGEDIDTSLHLRVPSELFADVKISEENPLEDWISSDLASLVAQEKEKQPEQYLPKTIELDTLLQTPPKKKQKKDRKEIPAPAVTEVIRVDLQRLERLNNLVGELVTEENASQLQVQQLQASLQQLQSRFLLFERLTRNLQLWLDQSQKIQVRNAHQFGNAEFDPLQMDYYSPLYTMVQEAVEEIAQMGEKVQDITLVTQQTTQIQHRKQQTLKQLRNDLLWARMIPLGDVLNRFPRMIRDLSLKYNKKVSIKITGTGTLVDKQMLEKLYDPLVHLVRNAFDHGIEKKVEDRLTLGKPAEGTIEIRAYHRGNQTFIEVQDDGKGIDVERVLQKAMERGLVTEGDIPSLSKGQIYDFLFAPDFSTAEKVTELSGRGMGMSAVLSQVQSLKGSLIIDSEVGRGTLFTIRLPLTLTISKLLIVEIDSRLLAIPTDSLSSIVTAPQEDIETVWGREFYRYNRFLVPLYPVSLFGNHYPLPRSIDKWQSPMELPAEGRIPLLLLSQGARLVAIQVDQILTEQELVIKPFGKALAAPPYFYGCTILPDGSLVPVIDSTALIGQWLETESQTVLVKAAPTKAPAVSFDLTKIMVIDDSLTARQTLALTLSRSGYEVIQASDGREALEKLEDAQVKAVFCDVEMPVMNGFEFLTNCRKERSPAELPVIMLTSRSGDRHRGIAQLLGANAYLTKPFLEGDLLKTLQECLVSVGV